MFIWENNEKTAGFSKLVGLELNPELKEKEMENDMIDPLPTEDDSPCKECGSYPCDCDDRLTLNKIQYPESAFDALYWEYLKFQPYL
jgi:hypothetical protein